MIKWDAVIYMQITRIRFEWEPADMWIGVFWKHANADTDCGSILQWLDVWICLLPCVPLHITILRNVLV